MHKLTKIEELNLDMYWDFIETFKLDYDPHNQSTYKVSWIKASVSKYRLELISKIRKIYTANDFYKYEKILNKLLWNLLEKIKFKFDNSLYLGKIKTARRSYSHKIHLYDDKNKIYYYFYYYHILINNRKDDKIINEVVTKIFYILSNRKLYEEIMNDIIIIDDIIPKKAYYPYDYPFPNINLLFYNKNKKKYGLIE